MVRIFSVLKSASLTLLQYITVEVAKRKRTDQSSVENQGISSRAVDGNTAGLFKDGSCILTKIEDDPWWQVDLGKTMLVTDVVIHNRLDSCCNSMLNKLEIRVGKTPTCHD